MKKCPACAEMIQDEAKVCRHCQHHLSAEEMATTRPTIPTWLWWVGGIVAILMLLQCGGSITPAPLAIAPLDGSAPEPVAAGDTIRLDRFVWQNRGDRYCKANATLTNTSDRELRFAKITMQFLNGTELLGSDDAYVELYQGWAPGQRTTWDAMYECPGSSATVELTAVSHGGAVTIVDPEPAPTVGPKKK